VNLGNAIYQYQRQQKGDQLAQQGLGYATARWNTQAPLRTAGQAGMLNPAGAVPQGLTAQAPAMPVAGLNNAAQIASGPGSGNPFASTVTSPTFSGAPLGGANQPGGLPAALSNPSASAPGTLPVAGTAPGTYQPGPFPPGVQSLLGVPLLPQALTPQQLRAQIAQRSPTGATPVSPQVLTPQQLAQIAQRFPTGANLPGGGTSLPIASAPLPTPPTPPAPPMQPQFPSVRPVGLPVSYGQQ
jgi:hypothetical protein